MVGSGPGFDLKPVFVLNHQIFNLFLKTIARANKIIKIIRMITYHHPEKPEVAGAQQI